jgi:hypothetical protein
MIYREADLLSTGLYGGSKTFYSEIWKACAEMEGATSSERHGVLLLSRRELIVCDNCCLCSIIRD